MPDTATSHTNLTPLDLLRIVPLDEAARLRGVSTDTLRRESGDLIIRTGLRRLGMRVRDALLIDA